MKPTFKARPTEWTVETFCFIDNPTKVSEQLSPFYSREEVRIMPGKKHLNGVSSKEQRQYEHIKESAQKSGRYGKRAKEVAARIVMKHHNEEGHAKGH
jgi:hypothetical protein